MKSLKSFVATLALFAGLSAVASPAYAIYGPQGDVIAIIYYPDGSIVI